MSPHSYCPQSCQFIISISVADHMRLCYLRLFSAVTSFALRRFPVDCLSLLLDAHRRDTSSHGTAGLIRHRLRDRIRLDWYMSVGGIVNRILNIFPASGCRQAFHLHSFPSTRTIHHLSFIFEWIHYVPSLHYFETECTVGNLLTH